MTSSPLPIATVTEETVGSLWRASTYAASRPCVIADVVRDDEPSRRKQGAHEAEMLLVVVLPGVDQHEIERSPQ